jgi:hypothetical protein
MLAALLDDAGQEVLNRPSLPALITTRATTVLSALIEVGLVIQPVAEELL